MSSTAFLKMLGAYRNTIGAAYPRQDALAVVGVFRQCADHETTTQDQVRRATGLTASNVSKIVKGACEKGWIHREASCGTDGTKSLSLTPTGRKTLENFELRCATACSGSRTPIETSGGAIQTGEKKSPRRRIAESRVKSGYLSPELVPD